MDATKTSYQYVKGELIKCNSFGSMPGLEWRDGSGNNWRAVAQYQFDSATEVYKILVTKYVIPVGRENWIQSDQYFLTADNNKYRTLSTGQLLESIDGIPAALDDLGNLVNPDGWVYNSKYFTIAIGYNPSNLPVSINYWVYLEIADQELLEIP